MTKFKATCKTNYFEFWASNNQDAWKKALQWAKNNHYSVSDLELEEA